MKFLVYGLAVWRVSRMLTAEEGPYQIFTRMREATGIEHDEKGQAVSWADSTAWPFHCLCCTSIYVSAALLFAPDWLKRFLAASMIAVAGDSVEHLFNYLNKDP